jgi:hypothetical protein
MGETRPHFSSSKLRNIVPIIANILLSAWSSAFLSMAPSLSRELITMIVHLAFQTGIVPLGQIWRKNRVTQPASRPSFFFSSLQSRTSGLAFVSLLLIRHYFLFIAMASVWIVFVLGVCATQYSASTFHSPGHHSLSLHCNGQIMFI